MDNYPSLHNRKITLAGITGNTGKDFTGYIADIIAVLQAKGISIYTHEDAKYKYTQDPETEGIWWDDGVI